MELKRRQALGLIETRGETPLIAAVDGAIKAAQVSLVTRHRVGGGLVTTTVTGELGSVRAALEAALAIITALGATGVTHVIPRPDPAVWRLLADGEITAPLPAPPTGDGGAGQPEAVKPTGDGGAGQPEAVKPTGDGGAGQPEEASQVALAEPEGPPPSSPQAAPKPRSGPKPGSNPGKVKKSRQGSKK